MESITRPGMPHYDALREYAKRMPEINPEEVLLMLEVRDAANKIQKEIFDVLEAEHQLSAGKLHVLILLHQHYEGLEPSVLADYAGVSRATISVMAKRMKRDGLVEVSFKQADGRSKVLSLTDAGMKFIESVLPQHYLRISSLMKRLNTEEQKTLISLLKKLGRYE